MQPLSQADLQYLGRRAAGKKLARYRFLADLGSGAMGKVLLASSPGNRLVAVKFINDDIVNDVDFVKRFQREVETSRKVSGAFSAQVIDAGPTDDPPWYASSFIAGPSLEHAVRRLGPLPPHSLRQLASDLAYALSDIHRVGLIHRDLKPGNVILSKEGARVIDFGIAKDVDGGLDLTSDGSGVGTPGFMSPEQAMNKPLTSATDIFSMGSMLAWAATGRRPFGGGSLPQVLQNIAYGHPDLRGIADQELLRIIQACLAKNPAQRPRAGDLIDRIHVPDNVPPWPQAIYTLIADQEANVAAARGGYRIPNPDLRGASASTAGRSNFGAATGGSPGSFPGVGGSLGTVTAGAPAKSARRPMLIGGAVVAVLLLLVGGVFGVKALLPGRDGAQAAAKPKNPFDPAVLRTIDPCKVMGPADFKQFGKLSHPMLSYDFTSCGWRDETRSKKETNAFNVYIGEQYVDSSDRPPEQLDGMPLMYQDDKTLDQCKVAVVYDQKNKLALSIDTRKKTADRCRPARDVIQVFVDRVKSGSAPKLPQDKTSLSFVDPCSLLDAQSAQPFLGTLTSIAPQSLHNCKFEGGSDFEIDLGKDESKRVTTAMKYGDKEKQIDLGGQKGFMTIPDSTAMECYIRIPWKADKTDPKLREQVRLIYFPDDNDPKGQGKHSCDNAEPLARMVVTKLPR